MKSNHFDESVETWTDGDVVVREYKDGQMHGRATLYWKDLPPQNAIYKDGSLIKRERVTADKVYFSKDGTVIAATNGKEDKPLSYPKLPASTTTPDTGAPAPANSTPTPVAGGKT